MTWAAIIAAIIQVLGPFLSALLQQWLQPKLSAAAARLGSPTGNVEADAKAVIQTVIDGTPPYRVAKLVFLHHALHAAPAAVAGKAKLTPESAPELAAAADDAAF